MVNLEGGAQARAQSREHTQELINNEGSSEIVPPIIPLSRSLQQENEVNFTGSHKSSPRTVHGFKWFLAAVSLYVGVFIYALDGTIAADIQSSIIGQFNDVGRLTWIGTGFPLGSLCFILPSAGLYAIFDFKPMFISSILVFEAASALCGAAPNMNGLIIGRVIAGVGGTGIFMGILNYLSVLTTETERGRYISLIGVTWGVGAVLGPVVGGAFSSSSATWRWAFYINLIIAGVCAPVYIFYLPSVKVAPASLDTSVFSKLKTLDWVGFFLFTATMVALVMVFTFAGSTWHWDDNRTIALLVVAGVLFIMTSLQQYFVFFTNIEARMFPPKHILTSRTQVLLMINTAMAATNIYVPVYYLPNYFVFTHGDSSLKAAIRLLPFICFLACTNMTSGFLLPRINYPWVLYLISGILMTIGGATMYTVDSNTAIANVYGYSIILGAGTGLCSNLGFTISGVTIMKETGSTLEVQRVISMQNLSQLGFQTSSLLMGGQIFQSLAVQNLNRVLSGLGFSEPDIRSAISGTQSTLLGSLSPTLQKEAIAGILDAMSQVYILSFSTGAITVISALLMKKGKLFPKGGNKMVIAGGG